MEHFNVSERKVCRVLNQPRSTQRYLSKMRDDEEFLTKRMIELATMYGRYDLPLLVVPLLKLVFPLLALSLQELEVDNSGNYVV